MVPETPRSLFDEAEPGSGTSAPLADRMRPATVEEFVGQRHVTTPGKLLRRIIDGEELASIILWGPPGSGKTTLARLLARASAADFVALSAVLSGVRDVREVAATAARHRRLGRRTILFIDEIHRFNKAQQDAFLPHVESGDLTLIGATTENPALELVGPLLSRCKIVKLEALTTGDLVQIEKRALAEPAPRGLGGRGLVAEDAVLEAIARFADGDARVALGTLDLAAGAVGSGGRIDEAAARDAMQSRTARFDKRGEEHYTLISALHKSIRNSDADATVYWLARMLEGGVDPRYVARRLVRVASEDVGLADPGALPLAVSGFSAAERLGMPECSLALAEVALYLAAAPKSNATYVAYGTAQEEIAANPNPAVPLHLRNAVTPVLSELGYGEGYRYAHDEPDGVAAMSCLPEPLAGRRFYTPSGHGFERGIEERLRRARDLQRGGGSPSPPSADSGDGGDSGR